MEPGETVVAEAVSTAQPGAPAPAPEPIHAGMTFIRPFRARPSEEECVRRRPPRRPGRSPTARA